MPKKLKCNKKNMRKWIKGLRSGLYTQGHGALKTRVREDGKCVHCCLGVACEVFDIPNRFKPEQDYLSPDQPRDYFFYTNDDDEGIADVLPEKVMKLLGVKFPDPQLSFEPDEDYLSPDQPIEEKWRDHFANKEEKVFLRATYCNDDLKLSFKEIADALEETYDLT